LMRAEESIWLASDAEIKDGLLFTPYSSNDSMNADLIDDWSRILVSVRARKMKEPKLAYQCIVGTKFQGYHFFKR
jgi:hypothetical protein